MPFAGSISLRKEEDRFDDPYSAAASLRARLDTRRRDGSYRELHSLGDLVDFSSNDYLGFSRSPPLKSDIENRVRQFGALPNGSTGSRLLTGNSRLIEETEEKIAAIHDTPAALLFDSGYTANLSLLSTVPTRHDTIIFDELVHASARDGIRLSSARASSFAHNDLDACEARLASARGIPYLVVESIYSMDGDAAPLVELAKLAHRYGAALIVDEAHATGIIGSGGEGMVQALGLGADVFARVHTFGKALGVHGAAVAGSADLRELLINFARPFIFTTGPTPRSVLEIFEAYERAKAANDERAVLRSNISLFRALTAGVSSRIESESPIQCVLAPGNSTALGLADEIRAAGFGVRAILSPTVKEGFERIRICIHSFNTSEEIRGVATALEQTCGASSEVRA